jgi:septal ring-binding cell division protein DamX
LTERFINLPEHSLLYIVDAVSDQDLIDLSEASYLVTKPGRSHSDPKETEAEPDEPKKSGYPVEEKPVTRLTQARAAKPDSTLLKKALLVLATLFFVAGVAWHFLAENSVNGNDQETVEKNTRAPEKLKTKLPEGKAAQSEKAEPHLETTLKQSVKPEGVLPEKPVVDEARNPVKLTTQAMVRAEEVKTSAPKPTTAKSKATVTTAVPRASSNSEKRLSAENQTREFGPPEPGRYPYSILVASHRRLSTVRKTSANLKAKGLEPFWVKVDMEGSGIWYGVFSGYYADSKAARAAIVNLKLDGALPKPTRYANWVGAFPDRKNLDTSVAELSDLGFSSYVVADGTDIDQLYVGAFQTRGGVAAQSASLKSAGVESRIVER